MKFKLYFLFLLLPCIVTDVCAQNYVTLSLLMRDLSSGGDGTYVGPGQTMEYTVELTNLSNSLPITDGIIAADIPYGTEYIPGTTKKDGTLVPDVSGKMPFAGPVGGQIGQLAIGATTRITYNVLIVGFGGYLNPYTTFKGYQDNKHLYATATTVKQTYFPFDYRLRGLYGIYNITLNQNASSKYQYVRRMNKTTGQSANIIYTGSTGPCQTVDGTVLTSGSLLTDGRALAFDARNFRLYYSNSTLNENLAYVDSTITPPTAIIYGSGSALETGATTSGQVINRMCFAAGNVGYALTANGQDLIQFNVPEATGAPVITHLGPLVNDVLNGTNDVLAEAEGDIFGDGNGKLYLIAGLGKVYRIAPATRVATYLGTISNLTTGLTITAAATAEDDDGGAATGTIYLAGYRTQNATTGTVVYQTYKLDLSTLSATLLSAVPTATAAMDFAGALYIPYGHYIRATQDKVVTGSFIDYSVEVTNSGDVNAAGVKVYAPIPSNAGYVAGSTKLNGVDVADVGGEMPFAVVGGALIPGADVPGILKPGDGNKAVIQFRVEVAPEHLGEEVCHQVAITYYDLDNNAITIDALPKLTGQVLASTCVTVNGARKANVDTAVVTKTTNNAQVGPNPFSNNLSLQVTLIKDESVFVKLTNLQGRIVYTKVERLSTGVNNLNLSMQTDLPKGIYIVEVLAGNKRIYKQKLEKL
ncbi:T9SS type A sorting domain-containing protein [[Flexibacter] sp. ATCC 35208]|uniref:T9SS type A sorting domain-containing protein n=1 Tax=[Flexibacter] sp. ATCC 35208 TaxID=1936242 RepID=UPI0009D1EFD4|nr:T9SS type A sorting domain-containing protein [[Flexibacter] sp. ATCC 35208]OMP76742.1 hypothetical protein BW716_23390 [[Flexibacter] sp. ATCC 35208]